ncbi:centromere protein h [Anaeramoeba flamelloides]|uniref:Centromere protein h n=1 Tax=Anaeramoeba flamelloides TaxID=1746091 RepID=A0AAV8AD88_9EUKA|nr:centromere protein h [Anaeramoeba flamelloides]
MNQTKIPNNSTQKELLLLTKQLKRLSNLQKTIEIKKQEQNKKDSSSDSDEEDFEMSESEEINSVSEKLYSLQNNYIQQQSLLQTQEDILSRILQSQMFEIENNRKKQILKEKDQDKEKEKEKKQEKELELEQDQTKENENKKENGIDFQALKNQMNERDDQEQKINLLEQNYRKLREKKYELYNQITQVSHQNRSIFKETKTILEQQELLQNQQINKKIEINNNDDDLEEEDELEEFEEEQLENISELNTELRILKDRSQILHEIFVGLIVESAVEWDHYPKLREIMIDK